MKITLADWKKIERLCQAATKAVHAARNAILLTSYDYKNDPAEQELLQRIITSLEGAESYMIPSYLMHPQSEWMGGDSDEPKNHKLREPNICPMPRRYFTEEELASANAECHGPCDWTFAEA